MSCKYHRKIGSTVLIFRMLSKSTLRSTAQISLLTATECHLVNKLPPIRGRSRLAAIPDPQKPRQSDATTVLQGIRVARIWINGNHGAHHLKHKIDSREVVPVLAVKLHPGGHWQERPVEHKHHFHNGVQPPLEGTTKAGAAA